MLRIPVLVLLCLLINRHQSVCNWRFFLYDSPNVVIQFIKKQIQYGIIGDIIIAMHCYSYQKRSIYTSKIEWSVFDAYQM